MRKKRKWRRKAKVVRWERIVRRRPRKVGR